MGFIVRKVPWNQKPPRGTRLNRNHPFMNGMVFADFFQGPYITDTSTTTGSAASHELVRGVEGSYVNSTTGDHALIHRRDSNTLPQDGVVLYAEQDNSSGNHEHGFEYDGTAFDDLAGHNALTMMVRMRRRDTYQDANGATVIGRTDNFDGLVYGINAYANEELNVRINNTSVSAAAVQDFGEWYDAWLVYDAGSIEAGWVGLTGADTGVVSTGTGSTGSTINSSTTNFAVGHRTDLNRSFNGHIAWGIMSRRLWTRAEILAFSANPYQIFEPRRRVSFTSAGAAANNASGSPSITAITSSGAAKRNLPASGTPSITTITGSGAADKTLPASGTPSITSPTSAGEAKRNLPASGTPSITAITSAGEANVSAVHTAEGTPSITAITGAGAAKRDLPASGTPSITTITGAGAADKTLPASGSPSIIAITGAGAADKTLPASGAPSITAITSAGEGTVAAGNTAEGTPSITAITSSGAAKRNLPASGTPSITTITGSGAADKTLPASGTPSITAITSAGEGTVVGANEASGTPTITAITSSGASVKALAASGTPSITVITSAGEGTGSSAVLVGTQIPGEPATEPYDPGIPTDTETPYNPLTLDNFDIGTLEVAQVVGLPEQLLICDRSGFRVAVKTGLVATWDGFMVRQGSWEPRHPQDLIRAKPETEQKGSPRPEPDEDIYLDTNEVSVDDL